MDIEIDDKGISFGKNHRLMFDLYHLDPSRHIQFNDPTVGGIFKKIVLEWAKVLESRLDIDQTLFFPFAFEDEWIEALKVAETDTECILTQVVINENGWAIDFDLLCEFITSTHEIRHESPEPFIRTSKQEIISALRNAKVITN